MIINDNIPWSRAGDSGSKLWTAETENTSLGPSAFIVDPKPLRFSWHINKFSELSNVLFPSNPIFQLQIWYQKVYVDLQRQIK